jgi:twitching motility protein PilT
VLLTGTTGSGKSTTLAAMIDHMNRTMQKHIVTIEDPIEFLHPDRSSIVNQREVGQDTASFKRALRRVLRQDPDVILVGEMRDEETVQTALSAAETGHLVLSTAAHGRRLGVDQPHHRLLRAAPAAAGARHDRRHAQGHRLPAPRAHGGRKRPRRDRRDPSHDGRVHDMILDPKLTGQLPEVIAEGGYYGMQTFDQHLLQHLEAGRITMDDAVHVATSPHDFKLMVAAAGRPKGEGQAQGPGARRAPVSKEPPPPQPTADLPGVADLAPAVAQPPAPQPASAPSAPPPGF